MATDEKKKQLSLAESAGRNTRTAITSLGQAIKSDLDKIQSAGNAVISPVRRGIADFLYGFNVPESNNQGIQGRNKQRAQGGAGGANNTAGQGALLGGDNNAPKDLGPVVNSPAPTIKNPIDHNAVGILAQRVIENDRREKAFNSQPKPQDLRATDAGGNPITRGEGTLSVVGPSQNGTEMQQRLANFLSTTKPNNKVEKITPPTQSTNITEEPFDRAKFYREILSRAGKGPAGDISLRSALGIIAQMEGQRLGAQTGQRRQDLTTLSGNADRQQKAEAEANRARIEELLGRMRADTALADRLSRESIAGNRLAQDTAQFEERMGLESKKLKRQTAADQSLAAYRKAQQELEREKLKQLQRKNLGDLNAKLLDKSLVKDTDTDTITFDPELYELFQTLAFPE